MDVGACCKCLTRCPVPHCTALRCTAPYRSVVEAVPKTGRTHQIRVHLQHAGHPIANDSQYGGSYGLPQFFRCGAVRAGGLGVCVQGFRI